MIVPISVQNNSLSATLIEMKAIPDSKNALNTHAAEAHSIDELTAPLIDRFTPPGKTGAALEDTGQKPVVGLLKMYNKGGAFISYDVNLGGKIDFRV